jgi:aquaporin related protein
MSSISNSLKRPQRAAALRSHLPQDLVACVGEFVGTTAFLFLALGGAKTALVHASDDTNSTVMFVACSFGLSILVTIWSFYRITGGLFSPAVTLSLLLCGCVSPLRAAMLTVAQIAGGIAGAALVEGLLSSPTHVSVATTLGDGVSIVQGLFIEALCTAVLVFVV